MDNFRNNVLLFVLFFLMLVLAIFVSNFWHVFVKESYYSIELHKYPKVVGNKEDVCFYFSINPLEGVNKEIYLEILLNDKIILKEDFNVSKRINLERCIKALDVPVGYNKIIIRNSTHEIFFSFSKLSNDTNINKSANFEIIALNKNYLTISFNNFDVNNSFFEIYINKKLYKRIKPLAVSGTITQNITLEDGLNSIDVILDNKVVSRTIEFNKKESFWLLGLLLFVLATFIFYGFLFNQNNFIERFTYSIIFNLFLLMVIPFVLHFLDFLSLWSFLFVYILICFMCVLKSKFKLSLPEVKINKEISIELLVLLLILSILFFAFHLFSSSYYSKVNVFYERQSKYIAESFYIPIFDPLSYLGKSFSFIPGYFLINASFRWLLSLEDSKIFAIMLIVSQIVLILSLYCFFKALNISREKIVYSILIFLSSTVILSNLVFVPRPTLALALFLFTFYSLINNKNSYLLNASLIAFTAFVQAPLLLAFPIFYFLLPLKRDNKAFIINFLSGVFIFFLMFLPNLIKFGIPYQISSSEWGHSKSLFINDFFASLLLPTSILIFFWTYDAIKNKKLKDEVKYLFFSFVLSSIIQIFISYRWNILTITIVSLLFVKTMPDNFKSEKNFRLALLLLLFCSILHYISVAYIFQTSKINIQALDYLKLNSHDSEKILCDPILGHAITYYVGNPVLADIQVEYADEEKFLDSFKFLKEKNVEILRKYNISYVVSMDYVINEKLSGNKILNKSLKFDFLDCVYSDGFWSIHRNLYYFS
ncbi:MAG: hypothetical protein N3D73_00400 [Candidatus Diapherotrites archaeon]|nr:hypothetical protein [Candidatus Diapherotrites archaeon]